MELDTALEQQLGDLNVSSYRVKIPNGEWLTISQFESDHDQFLRTIGGALVQFEDGSRVSKVSLVGEVSSVPSH